MIGFLKAIKNFILIVSYDSKLICNGEYTKNGK